MNATTSGPLIAAQSETAPRIVETNADPLSATIRRLGALVVGLGILGLLTTGVLALLHTTVDGAVPSAALVSVILGLSLCFPNLLQDGTTAADGSGNMSTMRVCVLLIVSTFVLVTLKVGWSAASLADLRIDPSWAWVLGAALGGKAVQSFAEQSTR